MKQHKWHKEIKAWADGQELEWNWASEHPNYMVDGGKENHGWKKVIMNPRFDDNEYQFRIKPQHTFKGMRELPYKKWVLRFYQMPNDLWYSEGMNDEWMQEMLAASKPQQKEPQYLYVYKDSAYTMETCTNPDNVIIKRNRVKELEHEFIAKIKLEQDDE